MHFINKSVEDTFMKTVKQWFVFILLILSIPPALAEGGINAVYRQQVDKPVAEIYEKLYKSLEAARFYVVFEPDIGANLARFSEKWGDDYNQNRLSAIRSMVFCNAWYANSVSNLDPAMLSFCPLHLTLIEREAITTVLFNRPGVMAENSPAKDLLIQIETEVIAAIQKAVQ
jgi:hypothetical protein